MVDDVLEQGWQTAVSATGNQYLYKKYPIRGLVDALHFVELIVPLIRQAKLDDSTHLLLDAQAVMVTLNAPAASPLAEDHYTLAANIDQHMA